MKANVIVILFTVFVIFICTFSSGMASDTGENVCLKSLEGGPCKAWIPRFGYDVKESQCVEFIYGGCKGNDNNFATMLECKEACEH